MPWKELSVMSQRHEFVTFAAAEGVNLSELCRRYGITRPTGYKWAKRFGAGGVEALADRPRRPHRCPRRTPPEVERLVLRVRRQHPRWGCAKIRRRLVNLGHPSIPAKSTITEILRRHGQIDPQESRKHQPWQRFERPAPNDLWQMDYKGHFALARGGRCHPLTILDDHSRLSICLQACRDEQGVTVRVHLTVVFDRYGLPLCMLVDNGPPWGNGPEQPYTPLTVWLIRLGVHVIHSRPYHPQTLGKEERFHRTLRAEVISGQPIEDLSDCQRRFDHWRDVYNLERPHEALGMAVPASRYEPSPRHLPGELPSIEYGPDDVVRKVQAGGKISYHGGVYGVAKAFRGYPVALRPTARDGELDVYFCHQRIGQLDLRQPDRRVTV